ncbi:MAG: hypothetical protein AB3N13_00120 [Arenibacterium sp.]
MKMSEDDKKLNALFTQARETGLHMPSGLEARILADAASAMPIQKREAPLWRRWFDDLLMGWYGLGGLAAASAAGIWLGVSPPSAFPDAGAYLFGQTGATVDVFAGDDLALVLAEEG